MGMMSWISRGCSDSASGSSATDGGGVAGGGFGFILGCGGGWSGGGRPVSVYGCGLRCPSPIVPLLPHRPLAVGGEAQAVGGGGVVVAVAVVGGVPVARRGTRRVPHTWATELWVPPPYPSHPTTTLTTTMYKLHKLSHFVLIAVSYWWSCDRTWIRPNTTPTPRMKSSRPRLCRLVPACGTQLRVPPPPPPPPSPHHSHHHHLVATPFTFSIDSGHLPVVLRPDLDSSKYHPEGPKQPAKDVDAAPNLGDPTSGTTTTTTEPPPPPPPLNHHHG